MKSGHATLPCHRSTRWSNRVSLRTIPSHGSHGFSMFIIMFPAGPSLCADGGQTKVDHLKVVRLLEHLHFLAIQDVCNLDLALDFETEKRLGIDFSTCFHSSHLSNTVVLEAVLDEAVLKFQISSARQAIPRCSPDSLWLWLVQSKTRVIPIAVQL